MLRGLLVVVVLIAAAVLLTTCGGHKRAVVQGLSPGSSQESKTSPEGLPAEAGLDYQEAVSLDSTLAELAALETPEGVDAELFTELKDALGEALEKRASSVGRGFTPRRDSSADDAAAARKGPPYRFASTPPTGDANRVDDLELTDNGDGTFTLSWHYKNLGDYDQNGTVGIADITPLAIHYNETYDIEDVNLLLAVIDGSGNGVIDIADITPIAMNYGVTCAHYQLEEGDSAEGAFTPVQQVPLTQATGDGRLAFSVYDRSSVVQPYLRVVPYDGEGAPGAPADAILYATEPPEILSVSPTSGQEDESIQFSAEVESAVTVTYAWDFGGGADPNTSTQSSPSVTLGAVGEYEAQLMITNTFGEDVFPFTLTVNPAPPEILSVIPTEGVETYEVQFSAEVTGTEPLTYAWDFGGGADPDTSSEAAPTVTLAEDGEYSAELTVSNAAGDDTFPFALTVEPGIPPDVTSVSPLSGEQGDEVTFTAEVSGTPPFDYTWDFKDAVTGADTNSPSPSGIWGNMGVYAGCSLTVTNPFGNDTHLFALTVTNCGWLTMTVDSAGNVGYYTSLAVVNGNPAISYRDSTNGDLKYVRASDASGESWGTPLTLDSAGTVGYYTSLAVVNGNPAISYYYSEWPYGHLKYVRASDASGGSWGAPQTVDDGAGDDVGYFTSLVVVNGNPAISYYDWTNRFLKYVRASDASGGSWGTPVIVDGMGDMGMHTSLAVVSGNPAISYWDIINDDLKYARATDANGTSWNTYTVDSAGDVGTHTSLYVVNGNPAISYYDRTNDDLKYVRAIDASGGTWGTPVTVDSAGDVGYYTSLAVVNSSPAISYYDGTNEDLRYVRASDASGGTWGTPVILDSVGNVGEDTSLAVVNGCPAISYGDGANYDLKFAIYY